MADGPRKSSANETVARFINEASRVLYEAGEQVRGQAARGKQLLDEKLAERELNRSFQLFGKAVFEQVARGKLELPESLAPHLESLRAQIKDLADAAEARASGGASEPPEGSPGG